MVPVNWECWEKPPYLWKVESRTFVAILYQYRKCKYRYISSIEAESMDTQKYRYVSPNTVSE